jgi:hypothetical protein
MEEPLEARVLECAAGASQRTAVDEQHPVRHLGVEHDVVVPGSDARQARHGSPTFLAQLAGGAIGQFPHIGSPGTDEHEMDGFTVIHGFP